MTRSFFFEHHLAFRNGAQPATMETKEQAANDPEAR
jgi:hypothetical protein